MVVSLFNDCFSSNKKIEKKFIPNLEFEGGLGSL